MMIPLPDPVSGDDIAVGLAKAAGKKPELPIAEEGPTPFKKILKDVE